MTEFEAVIGLETHIQLNTTTKIFCACKADSWNDPPNSNICPVCSGMPGVLPVLNKAVVEKGVLLAHAMHAEVRPLSFFDRKNYFTPTCPRATRSRSTTRRWPSAVTWICPCPPRPSALATCAELTFTSCTWKRTPARPRTPVSSALLTSTAAACRWWKWSPSPIFAQRTRQPSI